MFYEIGYTEVLTTFTKFKKLCLPPQWNELHTILHMGLSERVGGSEGSNKCFMTILYGLYNGINLDYGSLIWSQLVQSLNSSNKHSEVSCSHFWTLVTRRAINSLQISVMKDAVLSSIATFHTNKIIVADPKKFPHNGSIPETMYRYVSEESKVMAEYRLIPPKNPRQLTPEMQAALDEVEKTAKRGKKADSKKLETEEPSSKPVKSKKRKAEKAASSAPKKVKKMARKPKTPSPSSYGNVDEQNADEEEEDQHEGSPRGNTPPRSPTPEGNLNDSVPTPPSSPPKTTVQVSVAPIPPSPTTQTTTIVPPPPPVSSIPLCKTPLPPPIFSQATITSTPIILTTTESPAQVNTSDVGEKTEDNPKITTEPISPTHSSESGPVLGGTDFELIQPTTVHIEFQLTKMKLLR
ncbi:leucine-rich repeat extensin-like protein 2 [Lactuca sativa]|uniref:leucine-rich repeat extensin-like protein 2 n=1 Tax=Lactuca sativa TaxID=4236 RepID=UPI000CD8EEB3|nr:leucine-rich repeat extensin-like protein 2 [Lactuca sativa]